MSGVNLVAKGKFNCNDLGYICTTLLPLLGYDRYSCHLINERDVCINLNILSLPGLDYKQDEQAIRIERAICRTNKQALDEQDDQEICRMSRHLEFRNCKL